MIQSSTQNVGWISVAHPPKFTAKLACYMKTLTARIGERLKIINKVFILETPFGGCAIAYPPYKTLLKIKKTATES